MFKKREYKRIAFKFTTFSFPRKIKERLDILFKFVKLFFGHINHTSVNTYIMYIYISYFRFNKQKLQSIKNIC